MIKSINISFKDAFVDGLLTLTNLEKLIIWGKLSVLPPIIEKMAKLKILYLGPQ
jgi:hypothetical protein